MNSDEFMTITNADIYKKIEDSLRVQGEILDHAKYTNGKVAEAIREIESIKKKSLGVWIANHPFKFTLFCFVALSLITPDTRDIIINMAKNFI